VILSLAGAADAALGANGARTALQGARDAMRSAGSALEDGDVGSARADFERATSLANEAVNALDRPGMALIGLLPGLGDDVAATRTIADAAALAGQGGLHLAEAAEAAGWNGTSLPGFGPGGFIDPSVFSAAAPDLAEASQDLTAAADAIGSIDAGRLLGPLRAPVASVTAEITRRAEQTARLSAAATILPAFLGAEGARTYLLVMFNTSDPRGSGGYPGGYGLLTADGERLVLTSIRPTHAIPRVRPVPASKETRRRWAIYGSLTSFWNTTYVPDFPTAGGLMTSIWEAGGRPPVDGVIGADPTMLSGLLGVVGPVRTPSWPEPITADNVEHVLGVETFETTSQAESDAWQVAIGTAVWEGVLTRPWPAKRMASAIADGVGGRHLMTFATRPAEQEAMADMGIAAPVSFPEDPLSLVVPLGSSPNRAGAFGTFETDATTSQGEGTTTVTTTVTLRNDAPRPCPPSLLCGLSRRNVGGPLGTFAAWIHVYMPGDADAVRVEIDGRRWSGGRQQEFGRVVTVSRLVARPGETTTTVITYEVPR
jgi:hypothetical protein